LILGTVVARLIVDPFVGKSIGDRLGGTNEIAPIVTPDLIRGPGRLARLVPVALFTRLRE